MKDLALDVWEDLGRTRLAGVAVGLARRAARAHAVAFRPGGGATDTASGSPVIPTTASEDDVSFTRPERGADAAV